MLTVHGSTWRVAQLNDFLHHGFRACR